MKSNICIGCFLLAMLALVVYSCAPPAYIPNVVNTPLLSGENEIQASLHFSTSGYDAQLAYAATDNIGVMFNANYENWKSDTSDNHHRHIFAEGGGGYYYKLNEKWRTEVFGGFGLGSVNIKDDRYLLVQLTKSIFTRVFLQPAIGFTTKAADMSFATRLSFVNMDAALTKKMVIYLEPAFTAKVGYKYIKSVIQLSLSLPLNNDEQALISRLFVLSVGVQGFFNKYDKVRTNPSE